MPRLKFGRINHTTASQIFGPWVAYYTSCVLWFHPSEPTICKAFTKKSSKVNIRGFQTTLARRWQLLSNSCSKSTLSTDQPRTNCWLYPLSKVCRRNSIRKISIDIRWTSRQLNANKNCSKQLGSAAIFSV